MATADIEDRPIMSNTFNCKRSRWLYNRALDYLANFTSRYSGKIDDSDTFKVIDDSVDSENVIEKMVKKCLSKEQYKRFTSPNSRVFIDIRHESVQDALTCMWKYREIRSETRKVIDGMIDHARKNPPEIVIDDTGDCLLEGRLAEVREFFHLDDLEMEIIVLRIIMGENMLWVPTGMFNDFSGKCYIMSLMLGANEPDVIERVSGSGKLRRFALLDDDLDARFQFRMWLNGSDKSIFRSRFYYLEDDEPLAWENFSDLAEKHGDILTRMLGKDYGRPARILLYGAPGSGKTSFAMSLAKKAGRKRYVVKQDTDSDNSKTTCTPEFRIAALQIANYHLRSESNDNLVIIDEADDILKCNPGGFVEFGKSQQHTGDKGMLNTILDGLSVPTIWITNTPADALDESNRRRFDYSIRFDPLNCEQRGRIWRNTADRLGISGLFTRKQYEKFSAIYPVSAGGIAQTLENLAEMKPRKRDVPKLVERLMKPHCDLLGVQLKNDKFLPSKDYSLEGLNLHGEIELPKIVEAVRRFQSSGRTDDPDRPRMNLLLSGPPGTGKTEFVKYLGDVLNTKVNVRMGSDLLSMWVGGTEQNIKNAFAEAEAEHAILFLDEIDGMVQSRQMAMRSWEVTQVNELLYQMENFNGVMIGATNFLKNLDPAIHRRFTFKLEFDYLTDEGKAVFFERFFKMKPSGAERRRLLAIRRLAPGDFRTVRQSLFYCGEKPTCEKCVDALEHEAKTRKSISGESGQIGFV